MNKLIILLTGLLYISCAYSQPSFVTSSLPLSVDSVETHRVDDSLVRIIRHNMELQPLLEIERISTPDIRLMEMLKIDAVSVNEKTLRFKDSDGVFIEYIKDTQRHYRIYTELLFSPRWQYADPMHHKRE